MEICYDPLKNLRNIEERNLPFADVVEFDWEVAKVRQDTRKPYPEERYVAVSYLRGRLHVLCFTETEKGIRVIS